MFDCFRYSLDDNEVIFNYLKTGSAVYGNNFCERILEFDFTHNFKFELSLCFDEIRPSVGLFNVWFRCIFKK